MWTMVAARVASQPVQPDWPGYLSRSSRSPLVAAIFLLVAVVGIALRPPTRRRGRRRWPSWLRSSATAPGSWPWPGRSAGATDPGVLGATQTIAMVATVGVGLLVRSGDERLGSLVVLAAARCSCRGRCWLVFGSCWTAIGLIILVARSLWFDERRRLS